jgi:hypothetical protein
MQQKQAIVIYLPSPLVRSTKELIGPGRSYSDISELAELSIQNQLALDTEGVRSGDAAAAAETAVGLRALELPTISPSVLSEDETEVDPLSPFTNRLFPVKLACRMLANTEEDVPLVEFQRNAATAAREIGQKLREEDVRTGRKGMARRWVALPVGEKGPSTLNRFINHFTITQRRNGPAGGPLPRLGLVSLDERNRPRLTQLGWELGSEPNPVLDDAPSQGVENLSERERDILIRGISSNPAELRNLAEFRRIVDATGGRQGALDQRLRNGRDLNPDEAAAYRAGTIGRLHDLSLVSVSGTGESAQVVIANNWPWQTEES